MKYLVEIDIGDQWAQVEADLDELTKSIKRKIKDHFMRIDLINTDYIYPKITLKEDDEVIFTPKPLFKR
jgi:hypothetical protein